jgi:hypothetical protein
MKHKNGLIGLFVAAVLPAYPQCGVLVSNFPSGECEGTTIELFAAPTGAFNSVSYAWTGPDGFSSVNPYVFIPQAPASASGLYTVTITTDGGCTASAEVSVTKYPVPQVAVSGPPGGCANAVSQFTAADLAGSFGPYSYQWGNGQTTQQIDLAHNGASYPAPACVITNAHGCSASNTVSPMVYTYPSPDPVTIEETAATTFCQGQQVVLVSDADSALALQWKRYSNAIAFQGNGVAYTARKTGNYRLVATNAYGCSVESNPIGVTVHPMPPAQVTNLGEAAFCQGDSTLLQANTGAYSYQWKRYANEIAGATSQFFVANKTGNYRVVVTNQYGCSRESKSEKISVACREVSDLLAVETDGRRFTLPAADGLSPLRIAVTDPAGRLIRDYGTVQPPFSFGEDLPQGVYLVTAAGPEGIRTRRIFKSQ